MLYQDLQKYIDDFITDKIQRNQISEASSFQSDLKVFQSFLRDNTYIKTMSGLCRTDVEEYLEYLYNVDYEDAKAYRPSFVYRKLRALMKFMEYLTIHEDEIPAQFIPVAGLIKREDFPAPNRRGMKHFPVWYDRFVHKKILELPKNKQTIKFRTMVLTCYHTGIRSFDLCTLEKDCIFDKHGMHWMRIYGNKVKREYEIPIDDELYNAIAEYKEIKKEELKKKVVQNQPTTNKKVIYLYTNNGSPKEFKIDFARKLKIFTEKILQEAKEEGYDTEIIEKIGITSHKFRHNVAVKLIRQGADPELVAEFLGHKDLSMAQAYIQEDDEYIDHVFEKLENDGVFEDENEIDSIIIEKDVLMEHTGVISKVATGWCTYINNKPPCGENPYQCWLCDNLKPHGTEEYKEYLLKQKEIHEELLVRNESMGLEKAVDIEKKVLKRIDGFIEKCSRQ